MGLKDDIVEYVDDVVDAEYDLSDAYSVPSRESLTFGPTAKKIFVRALYIDLRKSKWLLGEYDHLMALRVHKAFLYAIAKCLREEGGEPRSFNGDSVLGFFPGKGTDGAKKAVRAAMKIRYAVDEFINPIIKEKYDHTLDYGIGIGQGDVYVGKSGVRGDDDFQDLIWIGWSVYHAVGYGEEASKPKALWISKNVWNGIKDDKSLVYSNGINMWVLGKARLPIGEFTVYKTSYRWVVK